MSARSDISASDNDHDDADLFDAALDDLHDQDSRDYFDSSAVTSPPSSSLPRRSASGRRSNASHMLEALEALSDNAEGEGVSYSIQELLEQLHSGESSVLDGMFPFSQLLQGPGGNSRFQRIFEQIQSNQAEHTQTAALTELCETLSLSSEEALEGSGFRVDKFVPVVVELLRVPPSMEILILSSRALSTILELFPGTAIPKAVAEHVLPSLCEKLLEIEYMDVAELALQMLDQIVCKAEQTLGFASTLTHNRKMCAQYRAEVINENGIVTLLQFIDFFPLEIQRRTARIVSHLCTDFPLSFEERLRQGLPFITSLLHSCDHEILESSFMCLQKLAESTAFTTNLKFASMVATDEVCRLLVTKLASYVSLEKSTSSHVSPLGILRFLSNFLTCVSNESSQENVPTASQLHFVDLPPIVTALLDKKVILSECQLLGETLKLAIVLLPVPGETQSTTTVPRLVLTLAHDLMPRMIRVYDFTSRAKLRYDCLHVIYRSCWVVYGSQQMLAADQHTELSQLGAFLARVLSPKRNGRATAGEAEVAVIEMALRITEVPLLHSGVREAANDSFERHGLASIIRLHALKVEDSSSYNVQSVQTTATRLVDEYIGASSSTNCRMTQLRRLVNELQETLETSQIVSDDNDVSLVHVLLKLRDFVAKGDDFLTAHEIACSGLVKVLISLLSDTKGQHAFSQILENQIAGSDGLEFVSLLSQYLQDAISSDKDVFCISGTDNLGLSSVSISTDLELLTQHIKVHVLIDACKPAVEPDNEDQSHQEAGFHGEQTSSHAEIKKSYGQSLNISTVHDTVVLVEPLARIETIENFIADKLYGRNGNVKPILDALAEADTDIEDEGEVDECGEFANNVAKPRKVVAIYNEHVLPNNISLLEAILKFGEAGKKTIKTINASPSKFLTRILTASPHDITFRLVTLADSSMSGDAVKYTIKAIDVNPSVPAVSNQKWEDVWDFLLLLKLLQKHCIGKMIDTDFKFVNSYLSLQVLRVLEQPVAVLTNSLPLWCFRLINEFSFLVEFEMLCQFIYATTSGCSRAIQYLCRTVWRKAVQEDLALVHPPRLNASGSRRRLRDGTSRTRASGLEILLQTVKLPRLKVRVARSRLLQSAVKLMAMYGGKKAVIEVEFLGEVGTGLGPTTEFFTLVCQQIQSKQLQLWLDEDGGRRLSDEEQKRVTINESPETNSSLVVRGYHRIAVYHCFQCKVLHIPTCSLHRQLLTHEKPAIKDKDTPFDKAKNSASPLLAQFRSWKISIPQCAQCLDDHDWHSTAMSCDCESQLNEASETVSKTTSGCTLKWWILSDTEAQYLAKVFPHHAKRVHHPVLQCAHCDTVNFPGTDAGIVVMDGDCMISRSGRRMYERDYRAVTKHVSPLCEGTPLNVMLVAITRADVDTLMVNLAESPEVLESEIESFSYLNESAITGMNIDEKPPVTAPFGLYPKPYIYDDDLVEASLFTKTEWKDSMIVENVTDEVDVRTWFRFLGCFVGQAILDERLLNLPFARPFLRALRGEKMVGDGVSIDRSLSYVDELNPTVANSLRYLHNLAVKYAAIKGSDKCEMSSVAPWMREVDAMCLSFTMIGADDIPLVAQGGDISVTLPLLHKYVKLSLEFLLDRSIKCQVQAFLQGFEQIYGGNAEYRMCRFFESFNVRELEELLCDRGTGSTMWDRDGLDLREHMVCDHGYTAESLTIANLVSILCELSIDEQRLFVRFVTGANRLPLGGLRNLEPKLTVVRKLPETTDATSIEENDAVLPSASTCTNYLKLPDYSTRDVMKQRLLYCINEGQCSFHLS